MRRLIAPIIVLLLAPVGGALATPAPPTSSLLLSDHALLALTGTGGERLVRARGGEQVSAALRLWRIETGAALRLVPELRARGALRYAEPDRKLPQAVLPSDPLSTAELGYHLYRIGADRVEPPGPELQRFPLTIVDTGLDLTHQEFAHRPDTTPLNEQVVRSPNRVEGYHGTIVASTAAAPVDGIGAVGVYPQVPLRVFDAGELSRCDGDRRDRHGGGRRPQRPQPQPRRPGGLARALRVDPARVRERHARRRSLRQRVHQRQSGALSRRASRMC